MSRRIENTEPLALLRELPDDWAQMCLTSPPSGQAPAATLAVFAEVRRVLRGDGTLWLLHRPGERPGDALREQGWIGLRPPGWARPLTLGRDAALHVSLLSKERRCFLNARAASVYAGPRECSCPRAGRRGRRGERCGAAREHDPRLAARCILVASSPAACGACGAPWRRARPGEGAPGAWRATCPHNNPEGRCLVLDPFYDPRSPAAETACRNGRVFLGITDPAGTGEDR